MSDEPRGNALGVLRIAGRHADERRGIITGALIEQVSAYTTSATLPPTDRARVDPDVNASKPKRNLTSGRYVGGLGVCHAG